MRNRKFLKKHFGTIPSNILFVTDSSNEFKDYSFPKETVEREDFSWKNIEFFYILILFLQFQIRSSIT